MTVSYIVSFRQLKHIRCQWAEHLCVTPIGLCAYYEEEGADHKDSALSSNGFGSKREFV